MRALALAAGMVGVAVLLAHPLHGGAHVAPPQAGTPQGWGKVVPPHAASATLYVRRGACPTRTPYTATVHLHGHAWCATQRAYATRTAAQRGAR